MTAFTLRYTLRMPTEESPNERISRLAAGRPTQPKLPPDPPPDDDAPTGPMARQPRPPAPVQPSPAQPPRDTDPSLSSRHPTGTPEATGGWYGEDLGKDIGSTPASRATRPAPQIDKDGMARLPGRVPENDPSGTRVQPGALNFGAARRAAPPPPAITPAYTPPPIPPRPT